MKKDAVYYAMWALEVGERKVDIKRNERALKEEYKESPFRIEEKVKRNISVYSLDERELALKKAIEEFETDCSEYTIKVAREILGLREGADDK